MMAKLIRIWRGQPWLVSGFVLALCVTLYFAGRLALFTLYWADPAHRDQSPQGWMTIGYVAKSWGVDRGALGQALDLSRPEGRPPSLEALARLRGQDLPAFLAEVAQAAQDLQVEPKE